MLGFTHHRHVCVCRDASSVFTNGLVCWVIQYLSFFGCDSSLCHRVCLVVLFCGDVVSFSQNQHPMKKTRKQTKQSVTLCFSKNMFGGDDCLGSNHGESVREV